MTDGVFTKKKVLFNIICLLFGLYLIFLLGVVSVVNSETSKGVFFVALGAILTTASVFSLLFNYKAFFHVDNEHISARFGWKKKFECDFDNISFIICQMNTLTIELKNRKRYVVFGLENAYALCSLVRKNLSFDEKDTVDSLIMQLKELKQSRKKQIINMCFCFVLIFASIFSLIFLTDEKDYYEYNQRDWIFVTIIGAFALLSFIASFILASSAGKKLLPINKLNFRIRDLILETSPLPTGNIISVYKDGLSTERLILLGFPNTQDVYYIIEELYDNFKLECVYTSEVYNDIKEIDFDLLIDITDKVFDMIQQEKL